MDADYLAGTLCHYTTAEAAFQHIMPSGLLRMSPYAQMRDPLENRELTFSGSGWMGGDADVDSELMDVMEEVVDRIHVFRDQIRLLSFTIDATKGYSDDDEPFMRAWARARMWEQYASNHAGVCIALDPKLALAHMEAHLRKHGTVQSGEVRYTPRGFRNTATSTLQLDRFREGDIVDRVAEFAIEHEQDLFVTKTLDWESEHEFRVSLVADVGSDDEYIYVPIGDDAKSVQAVTLGERFPEWQFPAAKYACEQVGVELLKIQWRVGLPWPLPAG
jgi:hypothetical protein